MTYIISHQIILACMSNFMCILAQKYFTVPTKIYLCLHLYTCVNSACNREVVGSSPTRGELFSRKF